MNAASSESAAAPDEIIVEEAPTGVTATATATLEDETPESAAPEPRLTGPRRVPSVLAALAGALVFAVGYALAAAALLAVAGERLFGAVDFGAFIRDALFGVPVSLYAGVALLAALALPRARWWLHVLASLGVAILVYLLSIGVLLVLLGLGGTSTSFGELAVNPLLVVAALVAREVNLWVGRFSAWRAHRARGRVDGAARAGA